MGKMASKDFVNKVLTGISTGVIITLVPPALLGEIAKALNLDIIVEISSITQYFLSAIIGVCVAIQFKFTSLQTGSIAIATAIGSGSIAFSNKVLTITGLGDIINAGLTATIAVLLVLLIGNRLKEFTLLLLPTIVITVSSLIGLTTLPYVRLMTGSIGDMINYFTTLQPVLMGILIAISFAILITSPISSVGVATAIGLTGISAGAANIGALASGIGLAVSSYKMNGFGTSTVLILGSPKFQIINFLKKPKIILPVIANAAILGALVGIMGIEGTTLSAGFGIVGLIGPITYLNLIGYTALNLLKTFFIFILIPIILAIFFNWIFIKITKLVKSEDYYIEVK